MSITMSVWREHTEKIITAFGNSEAIVEAFYKIRGSSVAFQKISGEFVYRGDNIWEITTSFDKGEYIIKVIIDGIDVFVALTVVSAEEYTHTINQELIRQDIADLTKKLLDKNSLKISG